MQLNDTHLLKTQCYINGDWHEALSLEHIEVYNPSTGALIAKVPKMRQKDAEIAIEAAHHSFKIWKKTPSKERSRLLKQWYSLIIEYQEDLAKILCTEQGKPFPEARREVVYGASYIEWFAEEAKRIDGDIIPAPQTNQRAFVYKEPIGVCAAITPWNFPISIVTRKVGPALAAGCTFVLRPASQTPLSALALAELAHRAGIPAGVFNVITGTHEIGDIFTQSPLVRKFSFTGSTAVGSQLMARCAGTVKKVSLELGGNAPFIVFDDADIDAAVKGLMANKYRNAGQTCVCTNRIYVQSKIHDIFITRLKETVATLRVGDGFEPDVLIGPLIDKEAINKVQEHIQDALAKGAILEYGGHQHPAGELFFEPSILSNVTHEMKLAKEETFGPLASIFKFETEEEVIQYANDTIYGLAAYFFSKDMSRIFRVTEALEYGMVGVNTGTLSNELAPFGGIKQSGIGREGSKYGIDDYIELKYTLLSVS